MSGEATSTDDPADLAGEYVLGTLAGPERRDVERRLATDAVLRAAVADWEARLLPLTALAPLQEPTASLWLGIERGIAPATAPRRPTAPAARAGLWNDLSLWRGLAAGGLAAALLLAVRPDLAPMGGAAPQYVVVLVAPGGQAPGWVVQVNSPRDLSLTPLAKNAPPSAAPDDKALQFWTKADDWAVPVSLGLVRPGEPMRLRLDHLPAMQPNQLFVITLEPPSGSPTGRPTGPIQYIGRAVKLSS